MRSYIIRDMVAERTAHHSRVMIHRTRLQVAAASHRGIELTPGTVIMTESLITGYQEMGGLNEEIVQEYLLCEDEVAHLYLNDR